MKIAKLFAILATLGGGGYLTAFSATPRSLKWLYPTEDTDFATVANWGWVDSTKTDTIESAPGEDDSVTFSATTAAQSDIIARNLTLSSDTTISNFTFEASRGAFTVNLGSKTLTACGIMDFKQDRATLNRDSITFMNGLIYVKKGGRFISNTVTWQYRGLDLNFDNVSIDCLESSTPTFNIYSTGIEGGAYARTNHFVLANNSELKADYFKINVSNQNAPCYAEVEVKDSKLTIYDEAKSSTATLNATWFTSSDKLDVKFKGASSLDTGMLIVNGKGTSLSLNGGSHTLRYAENYGENGSLYLINGIMEVTNNASLLISKGASRVQGGATLSVCDGGQFTTVSTLSISTPFSNNSLGLANDYTPSTLIIDNGTLESSTITFGGSANFTNSVLKIGGSLSRLETTADYTLINFNYGAKVVFEIPADGYYDADKNARAPVYAKGIFNSTTTDSCRPISLELKTKEFDKANPQKSITLMNSWIDAMNVGATRCYTKDVFATLTNNVTFVDSAKNPGTLSISTDGKSLIYTAPAPMGLLISVR